MLTLRLTQTTEGQDQYRVEVRLEESGQVPQTATARFALKLSAQDQEGIRWYLEDYLKHPFDPAPQIAGRIERRLAEIGTQLFE